MRWQRLLGEPAIQVALVALLVGFVTGLVLG